MHAFLYGPTSSHRSAKTRNKRNFSSRSLCYLWELPKTQQRARPIFAEYAATVSITKIDGADEYRLQGLKHPSRVIANTRYVWLSRRFSKLFLRVTCLPISFEEPLFAGLYRISFVVVYHCSRFERYPSIFSTACYYRKLNRIDYVETEMLYVPSSYLATIPRKKKKCVNCTKNVVNLHQNDKIDYFVRCTILWYNYIIIYSIQLI